MLVPCWRCSFAFNNVAPDDVIEFNVYDHNRLRKDSLMGTGSLSMRQVRLSGGRTGGLYQGCWARGCCKKD